MIKYEDLVKVNEKLATIPIKGKDYVQVHERVKGFRQICPNGSITTEILSMNDGVVTMKATVKDGETVLGTGLAQEKETSSFINQTSYIENCETSAVGRALGFAGIGVDASMASADEVATAVMNQDFISEKDIARVKATLTDKQLEWVYKHYKIQDLTQMTVKQYGDVFYQLSKKQKENDDGVRGKEGSNE